MARPPFLERILKYTAPTQLDGSEQTIVEHVRSMWPVLTRTHEHWFLGAVEDPKVPHEDGKPYILYISDDEDLAKVQQEVLAAHSSVAKKIEAYNNGKGPAPKRVIAGKVVDATCVAELPEIKVCRFPRNTRKEIDVPPEAHGLIYLPHPYVVPGVRFNEMYNWDSAFVVQGLMEDGQVALAKNIIDNMVYQIKHYGTILNGNRSYYIEGPKPRSQPPLLTDSVGAIYNRYEEINNPGEDRNTWLKRIAESAERYHDYWVSPPHLHKESGLSCYSCNDITPGDEVEYSEPQHYVDALEKLIEMHEQQKAIGDVEDMHSLAYQDRKDRYYLEQYLKLDADGNPEGLTDAFYRGDRGMRESGLDPSRLYGFFNVDITNYLPLSLNCLRQKMEQETADIYQKLAEEEPDKRAHWQQKELQWRDKANKTKEAIRDYLWDEGVDVSERGTTRKPAFRDRNINKPLLEKYALDEFRHYDFATALLPMWTGIATEEEAKEIVANVLPKLRTIYGLQASTRETGSQWDAPMLWAPLQVIAVEALTNYNYNIEAFEVGRNYLHTLVDDFRRTGKIHEKTEALNGSSYTHIFVDKGYSTNDEGFGWSNAAILKIAATLERITEKILRDEPPKRGMKEQPKALFDIDYPPERRMPLEGILAGKNASAGAVVRR